MLASMKRSRFVASALAGTVLAPLAGTAVRAQASLRTVPIALVSKTSISWPLYIADAAGYFAAAGLKIDVSIVGSAARTAQQLVAGAAEIVECSTSQAIEAVLGGAPMTIAMIKTTSSPYAIMGKKSVGSMAGLKGKMFIIGGPNDITRIYADAALARAGVKPDDLTYTYAGSSSDRFAALMSGTVDAAILVPPFNFMAETNGFVTLDEVYKYFSPFPVDNVAVNPAWAKMHEDVLVGFIKAQLLGARDFYNPALRSKTVQTLIESTNAKPDDAAKTYDYLQRIKFFSTTGVSAPADMQKVVDTLVKTGDIKSSLALSRFTDFHWAEKAGGQVKTQK